MANFKLRLSGGPWFDGEVNGVEYWDANYEIVDDEGNVVDETGRSGWPMAALEALDGRECDEGGKTAIG